MRYTLFVFISVMLLFSSPGLAQDGAGVRILPAQGGLYNNAKELANPYILPFWGQKLGAKGFLLPYPIGVMVNGYAGVQDVTISDLSIGVNDNPMVSLDDVVKFNKVTASIRNINVRTDVWLLPFLDVYGIFGMASAQTKVGIGSIMDKPVDYETEADFHGYEYGVGAMLTGGVRSIFFSLDASKIWTNLSNMDTNNSVVNIGLRTGYIFHFQQNPERNISIWTGATRYYLSSHTEGSIDLSEVVPDFGANYQNSDWYQALGPQKQNLVDELVDKAGDKLSGDVIHYSLKKRPAKNWAMILGVQYQLSRHWQFRTEMNFLGDRTTGLISAGYRFGIRTPSKK